MLPVPSLWIILHPQPRIVTAPQQTHTHAHTCTATVSGSAAFLCWASCSFRFRQRFSLWVEIQCGCTWNNSDSNQMKHNKGEKFQKEKKKGSQKFIFYHGAPHCFHLTKGNVSVKYAAAILILQCIKVYLFLWIVSGVDAPKLIWRQLWLPTYG